MNKIAIFVEGLTEQEFISGVLKSLVDERKLQIEIKSQFKGALQLKILSTTCTSKPEWHVLIANCNNDEQVKTQIIENYNSLTTQGYQYIIGIRDVFPHLHQALPKLRAGLKIGLPKGIIPIEVHLAVMEVEAWFIEEYTHFSRIDEKITDTEINSAGYDKTTMSAEDLRNPAEVLHAIYQTVGKAYRKNNRQISRTISALDFGEILNATRKRAPSLNNAITSIEFALNLPNSPAAA